MAYLRLNAKIGKHRGSHIAHGFEGWPATIWYVNRGLSGVIHSHITIIGAGTTLEVDFLEFRVRRRGLDSPERLEAAFVGNLTPLAVIARPLSIALG